MLPKVIIFLFIYLTTLSNRNNFVTGQTESKVTEISYECSQSKQITITPTHDISLDKLRVLKKDGSGEACKLQNALIDTCNYAAGDSVILIFQEDANEKVIGGHNSKQFQLSCTDEGTFTVKSAPTGILVKPPTTMTSISKTIDHQITLRLTDMHDGDLGSSIYIGQEILMTMATADTDYVLSPQTCTATGSNSNSYKLWELAGHCAHDNSVIADKWTGGNAQTTLKIKMYGFYFPTSTHVTIECTTKVCKTTNKSACHNECLTLTRRRRRDAPMSKNDTSVYERSVQVAFDVAVNEAGGVNSAFATLPTKPVYALMGFILYTMMQLT